MLMMSEQSGRVAAVATDVAWAHARNVHATCSHCQGALGASYYQCLTCRPLRTYVLCLSCDELLDVDEFHDEGHMWLKYK